MNQEQTLSLVRNGLTIVGAILVSRGVFSSADWSAIMGGIMMVAPPIWGVADKTKARMIAKVDAMQGVAGVVTTNNAEGRELADAVPSVTVAPAGTMAAASLAKS
jgi:hypothetical protein